MTKNTTTKNTWSDREYISTLSSRIEGKLDFYSYKLARYINRADVDLRNYDYQYYYNTPLSLLQDGDLLRAPSTNVIKSVIDSLVSKLSNNKVRPFFAPVDGTFKTKKVIRQAQQFFDIYYDVINLNNIIAETFKDACIFDIGYILINPFTFDVERVPSYCIEELNVNGENKVALIKWIHQPSLALDKYNISVSRQYVNIEMLIKENEATLYVDEKKVKTISTTGYPIVNVYYNEPINNGKTVSIVDELEGIQTQIDLINAKIAATSQLTPANLVFIDEQSGLKASEVNNKDCQIYPVGIQPGNTANPVNVVTPVPFDPAWSSMLDFYINKAYDMIGISQLSAQSRKPSGLDSGVALQTMEDIESDRFEVQVNHFINAYIDVTRKLIEIIPEDFEILPADKYQSTMTWATLKEQNNLYKVQYSAATALSKDPAERAKQIIQMSQIGLITPSKAAELMDMPDLTDAYSDAEAMEMAVAAVINNAVEYDLYDVPDYISLTSLAREITLEQNQLFISMSAGKDNSEVAESLRRLNELDAIVADKMVQLGIIDMTPTENTEAVSESGLAITNEQPFLSGEV